MFFNNSRKLQAKIIHNTQVFRKSSGSKIQDWSSDEYQFYQRCPLPSLYFQKSLPRLPIPDLEATCNRFVKALKPLLTETQYEKSKNVVSRFKNDAKDLQEALKAKDSANKHTSYISQPWFNMYLKDRRPLVLHFNPGFAIRRSHHPDSESQLCKTTNMTISSLRFMKSLQNSVLDPEVVYSHHKTSTKTFFTLMKLMPSKYACYGAYLFKAYPLDMSQYANLFCSTRIPQQNKDIIVKHDPGKHVIVLRKGHFFSLDVLDDAGNILPPQDILTCFKHILSMDLPLDENSVCILTSENRDVWAKAREHLISTHPDNAQAIKTIDSAIFVICLDDRHLEGPGPLLRSMILGDGYNRWFDKSFSLIAEVDGSMAINFEHTWGDGVALLRYVRDMCIDNNNNPFVSSSTPTSNISPEKFIRKLVFSVDDKVASDVRTAREKFEKLCKSVSINEILSQCAGRNFCKQEHISPDSFMQLAFQIAYHRAYGSFVSTYESCSTAGFKHGRTETLRPLTEATRKCALAFNKSEKPSRGELVQMIRECSEVHKFLMKEALMGQGFDRHLFGLKNMAEELGRPLPDLYEDEGYKLMNHNVISSSTLTAEEVEMGGFGPVVPDGLGIGYTILDNYCGCVVTSFPALRNGADFTNALNSVLKELPAILRSD